MNNIIPIRRTPNRQPRVPMDAEAEIIFDALEQYATSGGHDSDKVGLAIQLQQFLETATIVIFPYGDDDYVISGYEDLNASAMRAIRKAVA